MSLPVITVGERSFLLSDLPSGALDQWTQIEFCQRNIARLGRELALLRQIREAALLDLVDLLPVSELAETVEESPPKRRRYWPSAPACKPRLA